MKRSEMRKILAEELEYYSQRLYDRDHFGDALDIAEEILGTLERNGMLPPDNGELMNYSGNYKINPKWEPEDA